MDESRLTFTVAHEAWYWNALRDMGRHVAEIDVHRSDPDGGVHWEFVIGWRDLGTSGVHPQVQMFDDSWRAWHEIPEVFGRLATLPCGSTPEDVVTILAASGFEDITDRERVASR